MAYDYDKMKKDLFTDDGQRKFLEIRDNVHKLLEISGAFMMNNAFKDITGDSFLMLACVDRLVELDEIKEVLRDCATQYQVYVKY